MNSSEPPILKPGVHPSADAQFSYPHRGELVHVEPTTVGDPFAAGLRTWDASTVAYLLHGVAESISPEVRRLLPWALTTVSSYSPGSLGLFGPAAYSGPRATGLIGNLGHHTRSDALAAELVVAACLACTTWRDSSGHTLGGLRDRGGRIDFGVKLLTETPGRSTVEADILLHDHNGQRHAIDVKHSRRSYRASPSPAVLNIAAQSIHRGEIASFTFIATTRFRPAVRRAITDRPGIHLLEHVWPSPDELIRLDLRERQAVDYSELVRRLHHDPDELLEDAVNEIAGAYHRTWGAERELLSIDTHDGFAYLFDATDADSTQSAPRVVAGYGRTRSNTSSRDKNRLRGFPLPPADTPTDRGHLVARSAGPAGDLGINLIPQDSAINRGRGPIGRRWRRLERDAATTAGSAVLVRAVYDDNTDRPAQLEYLLHDGTDVQFERFPNRRGLV
jgi:hypothetical protein